MAVGGAGEGGGVVAEELAAPPVAGLAFFGEGGEPVLIEDGADVFRWGLAEGVGAEEGEDVGVVVEEALFGSLSGDGDELVLAPFAEGGELEVPIEAGLVGSVEAGGGVEGLRFVAEGVGGPGEVVVGALELDLVAATGHDGEEAVLVGDAEGFEHGDGGGGERGGGLDDTSTGGARGRYGVGDWCGVRPGRRPGGANKSAREPASRSMPSDW